MAIEFYDLKLKKKVQVDESKVRKVTFDTKSGTRYGLEATTDDERILTNGEMISDVYDYVAFASKTSCISVYVSP